jgi:DNA gyrase subunit B
MLEFNPKEAKIIIEKTLQAQRAREAARKARELTRRKSVLENSTLPGKLADCSNREPEKCEIYMLRVIQRVVVPNRVETECFRQFYL